MDQAIKMVESSLLDTALFMKAKEFRHFDAHFQNILTDGKQLFFSDYGLASSANFDLSDSEKEFFQRHKNYDRNYMLAELTRWIITNLFGKDNFEKILQDYVLDRTPTEMPNKLTPFLAEIIKKYALLTFKMKNFSIALQEKSKLTLYPFQELDQICQEYQIQ